MDAFVRWMVVAITAAASALAAAGDGPSPASAAAANLPARLAGLAPDGWRLYDRVLEFKSENLYEQIDGRAEFFIAYDVVGLTFASFEDVADTRRSLSLSVYDMGTPTNAFGVFSTERSPGEPAVNLGRAAYHSGSNVYVWKGRYYVQVIASPPTDAVQPVALDLARKTAGLLPDSGKPVWGLTAFPKKDLAPDSVRYFQVDALGLDFMRNTYTAEYRRGDDTLAVFLSRQDSAEAAQAMMGRYAEYAAKYGKGTERLPVQGEAHLVCDMGETFDVIFYKGRLLGGVTSVKGREKAVEAATEFRRRLRNE